MCLRCIPVCVCVSTTHASKGKRTVRVRECVCWAMHETYTLSQDNHMDLNTITLSSHFQQAWEWWDC